MPAIQPQTQQLVRKEDTHILHFKTKVLEKNHRIIRVGGDLWTSSSPTLLPRQGHLDQVTQECVQVRFECLYGQGDT